MKRGMEGGDGRGWEEGRDDGRREGGGEGAGEGREGAERVEWGEGTMCSPYCLNFLIFQSEIATVFFVRVSFLPTDSYQGVAELL